MVVPVLFIYTLTIVNPADGKWGHIEADGTWSGLVADAADGSVDFVIADVFIIYLRQQVFDGTTVTFDKVVQSVFYGLSQGFEDVVLGNSPAPADWPTLQLPTAQAGPCNSH